MKTKNCLKKMLSVGLATLMLLTSATVVSAADDTTTAKSTPIAANMSGKTVVIDGYRNADEGWTELPNLVVDQQGGWKPINVWLGTDGDYLYVSAETNNGKGVRRIVFLQFDFLNTHDEKDSSGNAMWTAESYREMLGQETAAGKKSASVFIDYREKFQPVELYRFANKVGGNAPTNATTYLETAVIGGGKDADTATAEFRVELNDEIKEALKNGTYTIGVGAVYAHGMRGPKWAYDRIEQYDPNTVGSWFNDIDDAKTPIKSLEPALIPDVVLPCTNAEVGQLLGTQLADMGMSYGVRFLATTDQKTACENYKEVGFDLALAGKEKKVECACDYLYDSVTANYGAKTVSARDYGAKYIYACTVEGLAKTGTYTFTVTPWTLARTADAEKVYSTSYTVVYTDGAFVSATPIDAD